MWAMHVGCHRHFRCPCTAQQGRTAGQSSTSLACMHASPPLAALLPLPLPVWDAQPTACRDCATTFNRAPQAGPHPHPLPHHPATLPHPPPHCTQALRHQNVKVVTINPGNVEQTSMGKETDKQGAWGGCGWVGGGQRDVGGSGGGARVRVARGVGGGEGRGLRVTGSSRLGN